MGSDRPHQIRAYHYFYTDKKDLNNSESEFVEMVHQLRTDKQP
jgi:hypothetical protein